MDQQEMDPHKELQPNEALQPSEELQPSEVLRQNEGLAQEDVHPEDMPQVAVSEIGQKAASTLEAPLSTSNVAFQAHKRMWTLALV